jgi:hypothetical protein
MIGAKPIKFIVLIKIYPGSHKKKKKKGKRKNS